SVPPPVDNRAEGVEANSTPESRPEIRKAMPEDTEISDIREELNASRSRNTPKKSRSVSGSTAEQDPGADIQMIRNALRESDELGKPEKGGSAGRHRDDESKRKRQ